MSASTTFDFHASRIIAGEHLSADDLHTLAAGPDVLQLGMLADALRRRLHGARTTYVRVAPVTSDADHRLDVPSAAREIRIGGQADTLESAIARVRHVRGLAGDRTVSAFSWMDAERWAAGRPVASVLHLLREAGLDAFAELPLDAMTDAASAVESLAAAGFGKLRLTIAKAPTAGRMALLLAAGNLQERFACIQAINPLPLALNAFRPTTGYDDVKTVALARLALPGIPMIQVDWLRYGPKLAQVALTFGADDVDGVVASDEAPEGRRRAPLQEIRRNIEAAGFEAVERDGRFVPLA